MNRVAKYLNKHILGNIFDNKSTMLLYSEDKSALRLVPEMVFVPVNTDDIQKVVKFLYQMAGKGYGMALSIRGNGQGKFGGALGEGMVLSMEKMNKVLEIDARSKMVRVQAGISIEELNQVLAVEGLYFPFEGNLKHTIGGIIAGLQENEVEGAYGKISDKVEQMEIVLSDGSVIQNEVIFEKNISKIGKKNIFAMSIMQKMRSLNRENSGNIFKDENSRYSMDIIRGKKADIGKAMFGSEGRYGIITEVILKCENIKEKRNRVAFSVRTVEELFELESKLKRYNNFSVKVYERQMFNKMFKYGKDENLIIQSLKHRFLVMMEIRARSKIGLLSKKRKIEKILDLYRGIIEDENTRHEFNEFDGVVESYYNSDNKRERLFLVDGIKVNKDRLVDFFAKINEYREKNAIDFYVEGVLDLGIFRIVPLIDMNNDSEKKEALLFLKWCADMIYEIDSLFVYRGGEGRVKFLVNNKGTKEEKYFLKMKKIFDPRGILNGGENDRNTDLTKILKSIK